MIGLAAKEHKERKKEKRQGNFDGITELTEFLTKGPNLFVFFVIFCG
jgi:hypothetical protein